MVRIAHLSDLHLPLPGPVPLAQLLNKRIMGYVNLRFLRSKTHKLEPCQAVLKALARRQVDLVVISGDLVSLALPEEFTQVDQLLRRCGLIPEQTMIIPGNHDRYTRRADVEQGFEKGMSAWLPRGFERQTGYPQVRSLGPVTVYGLDTAVWRGPHRAAGNFSQSQNGLLAQMLKAHEKSHPVIALHHPPWRLDQGFMKHYRSGLMGNSRLAATLSQTRATILHGHMHRLLQREFGRSRSFGVPSASSVDPQPQRQAAWHEFTFDSSGLLSAQAFRPPTGQDPENPVNFQAVELLGG